MIDLLTVTVLVFGVSLVATIILMSMIIVGAVSDE